MTPTRTLSIVAFVVTAAAIPASAARATTTPPEPTAAEATSPLPAAATEGFRALIDAHSDIVFADEDSLKIGDCPLVSVDDFNAVMDAAGVPGPYDNEAGGELESATDLEEGEVIDPADIFCDFDAPDDATTGFEDATVAVGDVTNEPDLAEALTELASIATTPLESPDGLGGSAATGCEEDGECLAFWQGDDLAVVLVVEIDDDADVDPTALSTAFTALLPVVLETLAGGSTGSSVPATTGG